MHLPVLVATMLVTLVAIPDDCYISGPTVLMAPVLTPVIIINPGTGGTTGQAGCDHCAATFDIEVIWGEAGDAIVIHPNGDLSSFIVIQYESTSYSGTFKIGCGDTAAYDMISENSGSQISFSCTDCM